MPKPVKFDHITRAVCMVCRVTRGELHSHTRLTRVCTPRHLLFYTAKELTKLSLSSLGHRVGGRDHTTIRSAVIRADHLLRTCAEFRTLHRRVKVIAWLLAQFEQPQMVLFTPQPVRKSYDPIARATTAKKTPNRKRDGLYVMPEREGSTIAIPLNRQRSPHSGSSNVWVGGVPQERKSA